MIYLACPYSHPAVAIREVRFHAANQAAAWLMCHGQHVFSPISHCHPIATAGGLPLCWEFWEQYDRKIMAACDEVVVLMLDGWDTSRGVKAEVAIAKEKGLPVSYLNPEVIPALAAWCGDEIQDAH